MTLPKLKTQLNTGSGTEGSDCGPVTIINAMLWASDGKVGPQSQKEVGEWVKKVRVWARKRTGALAVRDNQLRAYNSPEMAYEFHKVGLKPPKATYYFRLPWRTLREILKKNGVHLAVNYAWLRAGKAPVGSRTFSGGHALFMQGDTPAHRYVHTNVGDPLFDGRRRGIPDGYQDTRLFNYREAAGKFGSIRPGVGYATCIVLKKQ
jgi:hypothetical protein